MLVHQDIHGLGPQIFLISAHACCVHLLLSPIPNSILSQHEISVVSWTKTMIFLGLLHCQCTTTLAKAECRVILSSRCSIPELLPSQYRTQLLIHLNGQLNYFQTFGRMTILHFKQCICLQNLGRAGALVYLIFILLYQCYTTEEIDEDCTSGLDVSGTLYVQC